MAAHVDIACGGCGIEFCMPETKYRDLKNTGASWWCPNGCCRHWTPEPTKDQKRIAQLESHLDRVREWLNDAHACREELIGVVKECPVPGCTFRSRKQIPRDPVSMGRGVERVHADLAEHLTSEHGCRERVLAIPERTG